MAESLSFASEKSGLPPGTLVHVGEVHEHTHSISVINYTGLHLEQHTIESIEQCLHYQNTDTITWVVINGLKDVSIIDAIGKHFHIHALVLEDILNTHQRPKLEEFSDYLYIVMKAVTLDDGTYSVGYEQISLLLLPNFVFTFRERPDALFQPVIDRLAVPTSHLRCFGADYLAYVLIDAIIDEYFTMQDSFDELIEIVEDELLANPSTKTLATIQKIRRELIFLRRNIAPLREVLKSLHRSSEST
jgi:magnesium transporter